MLSPGWMFIVYCVLLRMTEGVGSALYMTSTFTILPILYPTQIGMITVSALEGRNVQIL